MLVSIFTLIYSDQELNQETNKLRPSSKINSTRIKQFMQEQVDLGPRLPGSPASEAFGEWVFSNVDESWTIEIQNFTYFTDPELQLRNYWITSNTLQDEFPKYIIGAHYDSRVKADQDPSYDPSNPLPVPGANDGASGVAGILELMKHLDPSISKDWGFALFDAEDQGSGGIQNWPWIIGSNYFVDQMSLDQVESTQAFILFDMIGNDELNIPWERNSDTDLIDQIWGTAAQLGYDSIFLDAAGPNLIDDHIPFKNVGIPSLDIIDFSYPEWHTLSDNMENVSEDSVSIVGDTILEWINSLYINNSTNIKTSSISSISSKISSTPVEGSSTTSKTSFTGITFSLGIYSAIWYTYFKKSRSSKLI